MSEPLPYKPTGRTALVIVPPTDIVGYADYYRSRYMPAQMRFIEPHITVTAPFVPYEQLPEAGPKLLEALRPCPPTRVSLRGFSVFRDSGILYLRPADPERIKALNKAILAAFPDYPAYGGQFGDNWDPHLTVGIFSDPEELDRVYEGLAMQKLYIGFDVDCVTIKYETDDGIWDTWGEIPLEGDA